LEFLNKPSGQLQLKHIEAFDRALHAGQLRSRLTNKPFAHGTQVDMRILLRIFLRWRLGEAKAKQLTDWLDVRMRPKTPDFLTEAQVERLYRSCRDLRQPFLLAVLFDPGARAEEFHNIRMEDVYLPAGKENFVRIALKTEYSKTHGRTVPLYWKYSLEAVQDYLREAGRGGGQSQRPGVCRRLRREQEIPTALGGAGVEAVDSLPPVSPFLGDLLRHETQSPGVVLSLRVEV